MKKFKITTIIAFLLCLSLTACGKKPQAIKPVEIVEPIVLETAEAEETIAESEEPEPEVPSEDGAESETISEAEPESEESSDLVIDMTKPQESVPQIEKPDKEITEDGTYDSADDVALYIHTYGHLPSNYITKKDAKKLGWEGGSVEQFAPGKCIGGDYYGNYEGLLPDKKGREYHECDIGTLGKSKRGAKRIIYSNDGLIYYTGNHYESFTLLYGEE